MSGIQRARWKLVTESYLVEHEVIDDELRMKKKLTKFVLIAFEL